MSLKHALLGLLNYRPMTGYDLKQRFDHSISHFWSANLSQIYPTSEESRAYRVFSRAQSWNLVFTEDGPQVTVNSGSAGNDPTAITRRGLSAQSGGMGIYCGTLLAALLTLVASGLALKHYAP